MHIWYLSFHDLKYKVTFERIKGHDSILQGPVVPSFCRPPESADLDYKFKIGSTKVLKQKEIKYDVIESMDISH